MKSSALVVCALVALCVSSVVCQDILCPQYKHLAEDINTCKRMLPNFGDKKEKVVALTVRFGIRCARTIDPDISLPEIKERRCKADDPDDFPTKFHKCLTKQVDTDTLLERIGFQGEDLEKFRKAVRCANEAFERALTEEKKEQHNSQS
uniref:Putative secreted protein n=1 Tax=Ornithodoros turicata TaxID=34597 RepID=A0A2R5LF49_9ACAR